MTDERPDRGFSDPPETGTEAFYDRLAEVYDVLTDWEARIASEAPFWHDLFARYGVRSLLDAACGTGGHALAFARWGLETAGADISPRMVQRAAAKARAAGLPVRFVRAGLAELPLRFDHAFDAVLCLGNSLPHVVIDADRTAALRGMAGVLRPGGVLVIHNLNFDRRWRERPRFFPVKAGRVDGREVLIWRLADYHDARPPAITFHTAVFEKAGDGSWSVRVESTAQRPVFRGEIDGLCTAAGLEVEAAFGSFGGSSFDPAASQDLIVVARRAG